MNTETMALGTLLLAVGVYDTYFDSPEHPMPYSKYVSEIFLLLGGALLIHQARIDSDLPKALENVTTSLVHVSGKA